ncbi:LamG domain-containing protein [Wenyingzhuangia aestuarii]|uniref:LamG domain-containing protein n=1 Tax=Wenyingzhuangia aestuarii TaxID=1647582 RepID=UPI00143AF5BA|nr:LamG domain-containing protein [Wenyingzhuangia aestuarii]NJB81800.1 hypothetical protein [Wenyingzhuangia aestuarii]
MKLKNYFFLWAFLCLNTIYAQKNHLVSVAQKVNVVESATHLNFGNHNDYVKIQGINLANSPITIEFYAKINNPYQAGYVLSQGVEAYSQQLQIGFRNGLFHFSFFGNDLFISNYNSDANWHHWACVYDPATYVRSVYQDGVLVGQNSTSPYQGSGDLLLGLRTLYNNTGFFGDLDDLRIWNVARTSAEINSNKECELVGNETGLLAYYKFNQGDAYGNNVGISSLLDATSHGYHGTFHSFNLSGSQSNFLSGSPVSNCTVLNTANFNIDTDITIFPNPTLGSVEVNLKSLTNVTVSVYDVSGRELIHKSLSAKENRIDISNLKSGMYSFIIKSTEGTTVKKILKN